jgi:hypothetical protein
VSVFSGELQRETEGGAKEDLGRPAPGKGHEAHAFFEVAVAGQEFESFFDEGFWIQGNEIGLVKGGCARGKRR